MSSGADRRAKALEGALRDLLNLAGGYENSRLHPGAEIIDAAYLADRILVRGSDGYYEPALKMPGATYVNGNYVTLLYIRGAEPIAMATSPGGGGGAGGWKLDGDVLVVGPSGDHATLSAAIAVAGAGDLILLDIGSYTITAETLPANCTIAGMDPYNCVINCTAATHALELVNDCVLANLRITCTFNSAGNCYAVRVNGTNVNNPIRCINVTITGSNAGSGEFWAGYVHAATGATLLRCIDCSFGLGGGMDHVFTGDDAVELYNGYYQSSGPVYEGGTSAIYGFGTPAVYSTVSGTVSGGLAMGTFWNYGTTKAEFIHSDGSIIYISGQAVDLNGEPDALVLDTDGDTTISAPTDDEIDFEVGGSDIAHITSLGLVFEPTGDSYPFDNDAGSGLRLDSFITWDEHFDGLAALPGGWAWAGAPFVTPTVAYQGSYLEISHAAAARSFLYKAHDGTTDTANYNGVMVTNSNSTTSYAGVRLDDGSDNNYTEAIFQISASNAYTVDCAHNTGGAGRTVNTGSTYYHPMAVIALSCFNTRWTNWNINAMIRGVNFAGFWAIRSATAALTNSWTPTRQGFVFNWQGASWHRWYVDAWEGD